MAIDTYHVTVDVNGKPVGQGIHQESTVKNSPLGTRLLLNDGREFIYCFNGGVALAAGKMVGTPAWASDHESLAVPIELRDTREITITNGATTAITKDLYKDGYAMVEVSTANTASDDPMGTYKIKSHPAAAVNATCLLQLYDPIRVLFAGATTITLVKNPYSGVVVLLGSGSTELSAPIGVPLIPVTIAYYFWAQTKGVCNVLSQGATIAVGTPLMRGTSAGGLTTHDSSFAQVATQLHTGADGEYRPVILDL